MLYFIFVYYFSSNFMGTRGLYIILSWTVQYISEMKDEQIVVTSQFWTSKHIILRNKCVKNCVQ